MPSRITVREPQAVAAQSAAQSNDGSSEKPDPGLSQRDSIAADVQPKSPQADESPAQPAAPTLPKRNWLERWLFPDQDKRSDARKPAPGLTAHFWTGGPPESRNVRDISPTGLYVVTEERWYPGTQIVITLTKTLDDGRPEERSITVLATAVRCGDDGVGLEFVCNTARKTRRDEPLFSHGVNSEQLRKFVEQFGATSDSGTKDRGRRKR